MRYICVPLTSDSRHKDEIKSFVIDREKSIVSDEDAVIGLEAYLKKLAWWDDVNGNVKVYLIKDMTVDGCIVAYFGLKAGIVIDKSQDAIPLQDVKEALNEQNIKLVPAVVPGIEISHFAVNDNYRRQVGNIRGLGEYLYPTFIYPIIEEVASKIGVRIIYLYAAGDEHLIQYYRRVFGFQNSTNDDMYTPLLPNYDKGCYFMYTILPCG